MTPELELFLQVILETLTLFALIVGLLGLIVPVFPGSSGHVAGDAGLRHPPERSRQHDRLEMGHFWRYHALDDQRQYCG